MARESAGSVYVSIDADASPLIAKMAQAESAARASGQKIASGLGLGLQQGSEQLKIFNALLAQSQTEEGKAAQAATQLATSLRAFGASASQAAEGLSAVGAAAHGTVPEIAAASGAIRVLEGNMPIRAVERFATSVLGLGPILQAAFPLVGAIALGEMVLHVAEKFTKVSEEEKKASEAAKDFGEQIKSIKSEIESLDLKSFGDAFGKTAEKAKQAVDYEAQVLELNTRILFIKKQIADQTEAAAKGGRRLNPGTENQQIELTPGAAKDARREILTFTHELDKAELDREVILKKQHDAFQDSAKSQGEDIKKGTTEAKAALDAARTAFKEKYDNQLADLKSAHEVTRAEELRFRQKELADALSRPGFGPVATEVNRQVGTLSQEVRKEDADGSHRLAMTQVEYASELRKRAIQELEADGRLLNAAVEKIQKEMDAAKHGNTEAAAVGDRAARQANTSATGIANAQGRVKALELERDYNQQIVHSRQQQIQYAQQLGAIEQETADNNVLNAQADVAIAQGLLSMTPSAQTLLALQQAQTKEAEAEATAKGIQLSNQIKLQGLQRSLGQRLGDDAKQLGPALSGALSTGIMNGGKGLGRDIENSLKGIGQKMLDDVFTKLIEQLGINAAIDAITNAIGTTHITAQSANTAAILANTAALAASSAAGVGGAAAGAGGAVASAAGTAATGAVSSIIGPVIGGVISGVISAAATFIGDAAIVKAINRTTAAVVALRTRGIQTTQGPQGPDSKQPEAPKTGLLTSIGAGLFESITAAGALPVKLVAVNPFIGIASLFSILGFASGGRPAPGVPYIVGERGPEVRIDDGPGVILPNVPSMSMLSSIQSGGGNNFTTSSSSHAFSIGSLHVHGMASPEAFARALPNILKVRTSSLGKPATR